MAVSHENTGVTDINEIISLVTKFCSVLYRALDNMINGKATEKE